jgi:sugar/nucleoside kinase (ribokinase family)
MKILCCGMMVCDVSLFPVSPEIFQLDNCSIEPPVLSTGGDALNVAVGLARLGASVALVGRIGSDTNGSFLRESARKMGIDVSAVVEDHEYPTAVSYILIDSKKERHFLTNNRIFGSLDARDIPVEKIQEADVVYFGSAMAMERMDAGGTEGIFRTARALGKSTFLDAAITNADGVDWMKRLQGTLRNTDFFLPSYDEARAITGKDDPGEMARVLGRLGLRVLVVKLGANGCYVTDFRKEQFIGALDRMPIRDTTGAGDSFVAGFICGIMHGLSAFDCAAFANTIASQSIGAIGATAGIPDFKDAEAFFEAHKGQMAKTESTFKIDLESEETQ